MEKSKPQFVQVVPSAVPIDTAVPATASCMMEDAAGSSDNPQALTEQAGAWQEPLTGCFV